MQLDNSTSDAAEIYKYSKYLADKLLLGEEGLFIYGEVVRLVGVGVSKLDDGSYRQMSLFDEAFSTDDKTKKLGKMADELADKFGKNTVVKGSLLK